MKRITSVLLIVLSLVMIASAMAIGVGASSAYQTYTYSISGTPLYSPDAYTPALSLNYQDLGIPGTMKTPNDLVTDKEQNVYIADTGNNRIILLNRYYEYQGEIREFINTQGNEDSLSGPQGIFVTDDAIWVCDSNNSRLVMFDKNGNFQRIVGAPESQLFGDSARYTPVAMAIDQYGRMYVVSSSTTQGIIVMDANGEFVGFIGAQKVTLGFWEILWRRFQADAQQKVSAKNVSTVFNNITITEDGFVYVTTSGISDSKVSSAIKSKTKSGDYMPVKLLNPAGDEIMRRNGFWPPAGEVPSAGGTVSTVTDVAVGPEKTWSIVDEGRSRIYTYDFNGNLLFAFGDRGQMLGSIAQIASIAYQEDTLLVLDKKNLCLNVYNRTEYGDLLIQAIGAENSLDYNYAIECWEEVLQRNSNFDAAYVGIGNAFYRRGEYQKALENYEIAYNTDDWSGAYQEVRKEWMSSWLFPILLVIVAAIVGVSKFFGYAAKLNKRVAVDGKARKTFWQEIVYGFYVIFHPFDGFYDLKHEHRGSVRAALTIDFLAVIALFYQTIGRGYVLNPTGAYTTLWSNVFTIFVPLLLFTLANWCLTTLFEGEGSFKDIFVSSSYCLLPMPLLIIPTTFVSNFVTKTEASIITFIVTISFIWVGLLLFFGIMITHDYSMGKNFITVLATLLAMVVIVFIVFLFSMLLTKMVSLVANIVAELQFRA